MNKEKTSDQVIDDLVARTKRSSDVLVRLCNDALLAKGDAMLVRSPLVKSIRDVLETQDEIIQNLYRENKRFFEIMADWEKKQKRRNALKQWLEKRAAEHNGK